MGVIHCLLDGYISRTKSKNRVEINNSRGVAKPTRFMGAYDDVLAGCFSTDVKAVVEVVIVATTAITTKRQAVNDNMGVGDTRFKR